MILNVGENKLWIQEKKKKEPKTNTAVPLMSTWGSSSESGPIDSHVYLIQTAETNMLTA